MSKPVRTVTLVHAVPAVVQNTYYIEAGARGYEGLAMVWHHAQSVIELQYKNQTLRYIPMANVKCFTLDEETVEARVPETEPAPAPVPQVASGKKKK